MAADTVRNRAHSEFESLSRCVAPEIVMLVIALFCRVVADRFQELRSGSGWVRLGSRSMLTGDGSLAGFAGLDCRFREKS